MSKRLDDQFDREEFYRGGDPDAEEIDDYELLPPDEDVLSSEQRRAADAVESAQKTVDLRDIEREALELDHLDADDLLGDFKFKFSVKHLLIAMAVLAVLLGVGLRVGFGAATIVVGFVSVATAYGYFVWIENRRRQDFDERREEVYRRHREQELAERE